LLPARGAVAGALLLGLAMVPAVLAGGGKGEPRIVEKELERRLKTKEEAQRLLTEGNRMAAEGNQCGAADKCFEAAQLLRPGAPATLALRTEAVKKFSIYGVACAREMAANGEYEKASARLEQILAADMAPKDRVALALQKQLKDPDRHNPALTRGHVADVKKVSNLLMMGEHYTQLGDYKAAEASYNQVLAMDSTNTAARRGLEGVQRLITNYLKAARDETRTRMLTNVDRIWESKVPFVAGVRPVSSTSGSVIGVSSVAAKLRTIIIPHLSIADATLPEVVAYLVKKSAEVDTSTEGSPGVNIIWTPGDGTPRTVTLDLKNVTLGEALRAVCDASGTRFQTDGTVVRISVRGGSGLETRLFKVPPGFLSTAASAIPTDTAGADPFATGGAGAVTAKPKLGRLDPKTFLEQQGVTFPDGGKASYNPSQNLLTVTNSPDNLDAIAAMVENLTATGQKQALVQIVLLKCSQTDFQELGLDVLLGAFNAGGGVFASGGTSGNSGFSGTNLPFNVRSNPMTAGLRSVFELDRTTTIDDLIRNSTVGATVTSTENRSPYNFALAGQFTNPQFQALFRGLNQKKGVDLSVATKTIVKSGQKASAFAGRKFFYPTEFDPPQIPQTIRRNQIILQDPDTGLPFVVDLPNDQAPVTPATPTSFQEKDIGSSIEVEANIAEDNYTMQLNLALGFIEFDGFINYGTPIMSGQSTVLTDNRIIQPVFSRVSANTEVTIYDGQTVAIGGLSDAKVETIEDKVPFFGSIPIVGKFFKSHLQRTTRTAVIYFVTVKIVDPAGENVHKSSVMDTTGTDSPDAAGTPDDSILLPPPR
jgi:general secretion pathway protein D